MLELEEIMTEYKKEFKKIPDHAKCVFKGVLHEVWQWEQEQFDGSFKTFECVRRRDGLTVLAITKDKKFIISLEEHPGYQPFYSMPGGNIEEGQTRLQGAQRELLEETGYESDNWEEWFSNQIVNYVCLDWQNNFFIARDCIKIQEPVFDPGEKVDTKLYTFEEFLQITQDPIFRNTEVKKIVKDILEDKSGVSKKEFEDFLLNSN
jgi:ADP-ribose pyrophosphatase